MRFHFADLAVLHVELSMLRSWLARALHHALYSHVRSNELCWQASCLQHHALNYGYIA